MLPTLLSLILMSVAFCVVSAASIVFLGSRDFIKGQMSFDRLVTIAFDWRFLVGALLAFVARFLFVWTNNLVDKVEGLAARSTTVTTIVNSLAVVVVVVFNVIFLGEELRAVHVLGVALVVVGLVLVVSG